MVEMLDGLAYCQQCQMPLLSDGEGHYRHIIDIPKKRLATLLTDSFVAGRVFDWLCTLRVACPCCGEQPNPFKSVPRGQAIASLRTRRGADDFYNTLHDLFSEPAGGELRVVQEMTVDDHTAREAIDEAERIIRDQER